MKIMPGQCATCPFRASGWTHVRSLLMVRALLEATPICHSTGAEALKESGIAEPMICRGSRDFQLQHFAAIGFIDAPTDEAWKAKCDELGISDIAD